MIESAYTKTKRWRTNNPEKNRAAQKRFYDAKVEWFNQFKKKPCMDCGQQYPSYVMDFDHRDPATKLFGVGSSLHGRPKEKVLAEMAKCDLVCANCHRIRTFGKRIS